MKKSLIQRATHRMTGQPAGHSARLRDRTSTKRKYAPTQRTKPRGGPRHCVCVLTTETDRQADRQDKTRQDKTDRPVMR